MAKATTFKNGDVILQIATDAGGTTFASVCGVLKRDFELTKDTNSFEVPDCDDEDAAVWVERAVKSLSSKISMSGMASSEAIPNINAAFASSESRAVRMRIIGAGTGAGTPDLMFSGSYHITSLKFATENGGKLEIDISLESDGVITTASVAAVA